MPALPFKPNQDRRRHIPEQKRKVANWREHDEGLRRRGSLTVWFSDEAVRAWKAERRTSRGGVPLSSLSKSLLSPLPIGLAVDRVTVAHDRVVVAVRARAAAGSCPDCRCPSRRVHSRYVRRLGDLPWQGRVGRLELRVRRFRCSSPGCSRRVFAERLPEVAMPRVRRTARLAAAQRRIALSAGGEGGARLASALAMPSAATRCCA